MNYISSIIITSILSISLQAQAQLYLGLSANIGNKLSYTPDSPGLTTPSSISGSLVFALEQKIKNDWFIQYNMDLAVMGFIIKDQEMDTLDTFSTTDVWGDSFIYGNLGLVAGKSIKVGQTNVMVGFGGGASLYGQTRFSNYTSWEYHGNINYRTNYIEYAYPTKQIVPYARISAQLKLSPKTIIGLGYTHHFESILEGTYEFYHTETPSSGEIALYPRELNLTFLYRISGEKNVQNNVENDQLNRYTHKKSKTYLGIEFSVANDINEINDSGDYLTAVPLWNTPIGINIRQEINQRIFIETGLLWKNNWIGYSFTTNSWAEGWPDLASLIIPLRFGVNLNLHKEKIYLVPLVGYGFGINPPFYSYGPISFSVEDSNSVLRVTYEENPEVSRYYSLMQTGLGLDFRIFRVMLFSISANYYNGFNEIKQLDMTYTVNDSQPMTGTVTSRGQFWCISTALKYPISNFWTKKIVD